MKTRLSELFSLLRPSPRNVPSQRLGYVSWAARGFLIVAAFLLLLSILLNVWVGIAADSKRFRDSDLIPKNRVGLVLGTSKYTSDGQANAFYRERILAAKRLYEARKVDCLLLSGDNTTLDYNEPVSMQASLLELGIPGERMYLDYAGVRTLDSILRAHDIFGLERFTIVSQPFHVDRAIFIAESNGLSAIGYEAGEVGFWLAPRTYVREFFSRILLFYDIFIGTEPKFGGEKIEIVTDPDLRPVPNKICSPRE